MTTYIFVKIQPFRKWTILVLHNSSTINNKNTRFYNDSKRIVMRGVHFKSLIKGSRSRVSLNKIQKTEANEGLQSTYGTSRMTSSDDLHTNT